MVSELKKVKKYRIDIQKTQKLVFKLSILVNIPFDKVLYIFRQSLFSRCLLQNCNRYTITEYKYTKIRKINAKY